MTWIGYAGTSLNPEQFCIAGLDLFGCGLDAGCVFLHQLEVRNLPPSGLRLHLRMRRILRGIVGEELLGLAQVPDAAAQPAMSGKNTDALITSSMPSPSSSCPLSWLAGGSITRMTAPFTRPRVIFAFAIVVCTGLPTGRLALPCPWSLLG